MKKIRIDKMYRKVYFEKSGNYWFSFLNKKDLINQLRDEKPSLKADCRCLYSTIEERFNNI